MDELDRAIINQYQGGIPLSERPYRDMAEQLGSSESAVLSRIKSMLDSGLLTRCGPLYNIDKMGGIFSLCALKAPKTEFETISAKVNAFPEVAHNYERDHKLNMWFVLAAESEPALLVLIAQIEESTGLEVFNFPKQQEFYVQLMLKA